MIMEGKAAKFLIKGGRTLTGPLAFDYFMVRPSTSPASEGLNALFAVSTISSLNKRKVLE
jgi:hypothetical protein